MWGSYLYILRNLNKRNLTFQPKTAFTWPPEVKKQANKSCNTAYAERIWQSISTESKYLSVEYLGFLRMRHLWIAGLRASLEAEKLRYFPSIFKINSLW
jgi:hypothetical protein